MPAANTSNISTIQILRSYSNSAPLTLDDGQLAFSFVSNTLFIGSNTGIKVVSNPSTDVKANAAYFHANGAFIKANAAFDNSNTKVSKSGDRMTGSLQFFGPTFAIGQYDGVGGIDLYANNTTSHAQLNFANTNFSYVDAYEAALQTPNSQVLAYTSGNVEIFTSTDGSATRDTWTFDTTGTLTVPGPISGLGNSKLDFTTYGSNTVYLTTTNDDSTALFMGKTDAELYAETSVQIRANTKGTSQNWTFGAGGTLTFPDNTIQTTAYTPGGEIDELARATANAAYFHANGAFLKANASFNQANLTIGVDASQNVRLAFSNTRMDISDGVNTTQNTRLTVIENTDLSQNVRLNFSNTRMDISDGVNASQNVRLDFSNTRMTISDGVNASQNSRLDFSNTRMTIIDGVDASQNARITIIEGTDVSQNARMTIIEGVNVTQNTDIANKLSLSGASYQTVSGNVAFLNDVSVSGNLIVLGNTISLNVTSLEVKDTLIQLGIGNYNTDVLTIGYVGHYNDGTNAQAGMIRDAGTKEFYAFQGYTPGVTGNTVNINDASFTKANIQSNWFKGNLIATTARVGGLDIKDFATASFNQANTGTVLAQASFNQANATVGVDATQNTRLTVIEGTDVSQNVRLDYSNTAITIIQGVDVTQNTRLTVSEGVDLSQNVRLDFSNTRMTIIEGVDVGQNTRMTVSDGVDLSQNVRIDYSNTALTIVQGVDNSQNVRLDYSNTAITIIQGVDVGQNARMAIIEGTDVSQNVRLNFSNTRMDISDGVNASQNVRLDFSNTRMTIIEGVNVTQNTAIASTDGKMQSAYNQANTGTVLAQAAFNRANSTPNNYLANTFVVANSTGYLSNSNVFFVSANNTTVINGNLNVINTLVTNNIISTGSGVANISSVTNLDLFSPTSVRIVGGGTLKLPNLSDAQKSTIVATNGDIIYNTTKNKVETYENGNWINSDRAVTNIANVWLANSIIFANTIGYLSNSSSLQYISSNNTIITGNIITTGISGDISNANNIFANTFIANGVNLYNFANAAFNVANTSSANTIIIQGVDTSQNVRLDYSNAAITIIQGTDTSQNARMTIIEGTDASQNVRLDYSNTALTIAQGVDNSQNVRLDFSNTRMTIIEGVDTTQNTRLTVIEGTDASQNVRLDYSNTALTIAQGVDNSQNVRLDFSNTAITIIQGTDVSQNARMTIIEGTDVSQNVRLDYSNTAITIIQGVDVTQNTRLTVTEGTDASQNVRLDFSNARMTIIEGVDVTQNTDISNRLALSGAASQTVTGNVVFGNNLTVTGNLIVLGNTLSLNVSSLEVKDTLIQLGIGNYATDALSIGYVGHYNDGTNAHAGFIRDSGTKEFYAFQGYVPDTTSNTININDATFIKANIQGNWFKGNLIATTARVGGLDVNNFVTAAFNQANTADVRSTASYFHANGAFIKANAAFDQANVTIGVDASQNSRMTIIEGTDLSQNVRLDYSNTALTIAQGVDNSQNVRLDYSNTAITIIQGTDTTQNTRLTVIEGTDASQNVRLDFSNTRMTIIEGVDVEQNTRMTVIEGTDVGQNSRMTIIENTDLSQNVRLAFSNTRMDIIDGVNASQNVRLDYSNTALTIAQGVDNSQNVRIDYSNTAITQVDNKAQAAFDKANTGTGTVIDQYARDTANAGYFHANGAFIRANAAFDGANVVAGGLVTANANIVVIQGVDVGQNTRLTVSEGVDLSQNVRLDFSNTAITIIQGVDTTQNTRLTVIEGTDASQNIRLDYSNTAITQVDNKAQAAFDKANTGGGASAIDQIARDTANAGYFHANGAFIRANAAFDAANVVAGGLITSNASVVIIQGVDVGQNSRMTIIEGTDASQNVRLDYSNTAITIIQGVDSGQNSRMTIIEGVDVTQNTNIAATNQYATSAFSTANNAYTKANNALANTSGTFAGNLTVTGNVIANSFTTSGSSGNIFGANFVYANTFVSSNAYIFPDGSVQTTAASASLVSGAYNQANTATVLAQAAYNQANVTINTANNAVANLGPVITTNSVARVIIANTTISTGATSGALVVNGGIGATGNLYLQAPGPMIDTTLKVAAFGGNANLVVDGGTSSNFKLGSCSATLLYTTGTIVDANIVGIFSTTLNVGSQLSTSNVQIYTGDNGAASLKIYSAGSGPAYANIGSTPSVGSQVNIISSLPSTSNSSGALVVRGGVGVSGNIYVGGTNADVNGIYTDVLRYAANGLPWVMNAGGGGGGGGLPTTAFSRVIISGQPDAIANIANAPLTLVAGSGITLATDGVANSITITSTGGGGGGASPFGYLANTIIVANSAGYLSNSNSLFIGSNNTVILTGNLIANSVMVSGGVEIVTPVRKVFPGGFFGSIVTIRPTESVVLNDISNQFDNHKCVFNLVSEQSNVVSILNSRNLEVVINGAKLAPYVTELRYPWLTPYDSFKGHRVVDTKTPGPLSSQVVIYNPPAPGDQAILTLINNSSRPQNRRYPYSAVTIALGD